MNHCRDLLLRFDAGRIEAVRAGFRIGVEPVDHHVEIGLPDQKPLAAAGQQHAAVVGIDRRPRRLDALDRKRALVERVCLVAGGILDRQPGDAGGNRARDIDGDLLRLVREAALEIGIDGQIDRVAQRGEMAQTSSSVTRLSALPIDHAKPALVEASALKPRCCSARALPTSPGIGQHESICFVHLAECRSFFCCCDRHGLSLFLCSVGCVTIIAGRALR